jgi:2',3'-cyclic-nucleotide 2'-phosphodiesterase (5'-nucleotidase family)
LVDKFSKGKKIEPALHFVFKNSDEDSLRITIIGFTKTQYPEKSFWTSLTGFVFRDIFKSLDEQFQKYYKITDLFIILSHLGIEDDKLLAKYIYDNYLDKYFIILGGHEHKEFFDDEFVPLIHTPPFLEKITKIELIFKGSKEKILENVFLHRIDL